MRRRRRKSLIACILSLSACAAAGARADSILYFSDRPWDRAVAAAMAEAVPAVPAPRRLGVRAGDLFDPIEKGRLLARLERERLIIVVGDELSAFAARELGPGALLLVGVGALPPGVDGRPDSAAVLTLDPAGLRKQLGAETKRADILATPEQREIATALSRELRRAGLKTGSHFVARRGELVGASRSLWAPGTSVWLLGDGRIYGTASFEHLTEQSIAHRVPLVSARVEAVGRGAYLSSRAAPKALAQAAAVLLKTRPGSPWSPVAVAFAGGGEPVVNESLERRWRAAGR